MFDARTWVQRVVHEAVLACGTTTTAIEAYVAERKAALPPEHQDAVDRTLKTLGFYEPGKPFDMN